MPRPLEGRIETMREFEGSSDPMPTGQGVITEIAEDGKPLDYVDDNGTQWVMASCGHRVGGGVRVGQKIDLCPNCRFLMRFHSIPVMYPERSNYPIV